MARVLPGDTTSDAPPRPEHARPPGWMPPVHPPPAPVAAAPVASRAFPPLSVRPRPPRPAKPAASAAPSPPAVPARPGGFAILAWFLGFRLFRRVADVLSADAPVGFAETVGRMADVGSVALGAALVVGLWRFEWWVGRAAVFWGASLVVLRALDQLGSAKYYSGPGPFLGELIFSLILPAIVVFYVWDGSRGLVRAPSP